MFFSVLECFLQFSENFLYGVIKVSRLNKSVHIANSGQWHEITLNNFFLHVLNHDLKRFSLILLYTFLIRTIFSRVTKLKLGNE